MNITEGPDFDIAVFGAGCAGFCAAVQAARAGMKTAIFERYGMPGGIMTVGGNNDVAQFYAHHIQIIAGIGWEFILRLNEKGFAPIPDMSLDRPHPYYGIRVNIPAAAAMINEMLTEAGVHIFYNQPAVSADTSEADGITQIDGVIITTKAGLVRIKAKLYIDCTGDGDVAAWSGAGYEIGKTLQPGTVRYFFDRAPDDGADEALAAAVKRGDVPPAYIMNHTASSLAAAQGCNVNHISNINGADSDSKTSAEIEGRAAVMRIAAALYGRASISSISPETAVRETRRIVCDGYITAEDYIAAREYSDSVCNSFYPIDLHRSGTESIYQIFLTDGQVPHIPLSALIVKGLGNLYVAGRCASGDRLANSAYRVKASCMAMGQAAAAAAVIAVRDNRSDPRGCDLGSIKELLRSHGAIVP